MFRHDTKELFVHYAGRCEEKGKIADIFLKVNQEDNYGIRDTLIDCSGECLPEPVIRTMIVALQEWADEEKDEYRKRHHLRLIESLARQIKDADLFEKTRIASWDELLLEIYRKQGNTVKMTDLLYRNFRSFHSVDTLQALLDVIRIVMEGGAGDFFRKLRSGHRIIQGICGGATLLGLRHIRPEQAMAPHFIEKLLFFRYIEKKRIFILFFRYIWATMVNMIAREEYMRKIRPFMNTPVVKVFTGIRRCGKSVMMNLVQAELKAQGVRDEKVLTFNFESGTDERVRSVKSVLTEITARKAEASGTRLYLFFDEIQELSGWETLVNSLLIDVDADIYITGSNAHLLSGELATYLAGRYVEIKIYPFSFVESLAALADSDPSLSEEEAFRLFLVRGGFPFLYNYPFSDSDANQYITDIFDSTILKDIAQRNSVRDIAQLRRLVLFFVVNTGNTFSAGSLVKYLKNQRRSVSTETMYNYIEYCRSACLLHLAQRQDLAGKALLATQEKIYLADHGIRQALYGNNLRDINQVLENIVYMELLRRGYDVTVGKSKNAEVDFCAKKAADIIYVQVCYLLAGQETMEREFGALESIGDNYPKYVLSLDEINRGRNGIMHKNIREFLLGR